MVDEVINALYDHTFHFGYDYVYTVNYTPKNDEEFRLHAHDDRYEILLILSGDEAFHIEGNIYKSHPHDMYIARPMEMHHNVFLSSKRYERVVIHLMLDFFRQHQCTELEKVFLQRDLGVNCQIPARIVDQEMYHLIMKMNRYLKEGAYTIANGVLLEFLYLLNNITEPLTEPATQDPRLQNVLLYINEHLSETLSLDHLAETFYLNKYHLCRVFKTTTGYTLNQYINYKRLLLVHDLYKKGQTLLEASANAGFNSYAHFYKMHKKTFGHSPRLSYTLPSLERL